MTRLFLLNANMQQAERQKSDVSRRDAGKQTNGEARHAIKDVVVKLKDLSVEEGAQQRKQPPRQQQQQRQQDQPRQQQQQRQSQQQQHMQQFPELPQHPSPKTVDGPAAVDQFKVSWLTHCTFRGRCAIKNNCITNK